MCELMLYIYMFAFVGVFVCTYICFYIELFSIMLFCIFDVNVKNKDFIRPRKSMFGGLIQQRNCKYFSLGNEFLFSREIITHIIKKACFLLVSLSLQKQKCVRPRNLHVAVQLVNAFH